MTAYLLSPAAESDVNDIWDYSLENWGIVQAVSYVGDIRDTCSNLALGRGKCRPATVRKGYQKALIGSYIIYFRQTESRSIVVVRILHQSMDEERHLIGEAALCLTSRKKEPSSHGDTHPAG